MDPFTQILLAIAAIVLVVCVGFTLVMRAFARFVEAMVYAESVASALPPEPDAPERDLGSFN